MSGPINPYASPEVEEKLSSGALWARETSPSLRQTGLGLTLIYIGIIVLLLSLMVMFFGGMALAAVGPGAMVAVFGMATFAIIIAFVLMFVGPLVCMAVPAETGAKGFLIGSVVFQLANLGFVIASIFISLPIATTPVMGGAVQVMGPIGFLLFVMFLKKLSQYIGRDDLARSAQTILVGILVIIGLGVVMAVGLMGGVPILGLLGIVVALGALILFVMYANLVNSLRKALRP